MYVGSWKPRPTIDYGELIMLADEYLVEELKDACADTVAPSIEGICCNGPNLINSQFQTFVMCLR